MTIKSLYEAVGGDYKDVVKRLISEEFAAQLALGFLDDDGFSSLEKAMKNEGLIEMLSLEKSLVYFSTSLRANTAVLDKFPRLVKFFEEDDDLWDDVLIENRQAIEMSNIYRDILSGTMDTYASIISNNLNVVMKTLTVLTLLVDTPAMIAALWGMNTGVPFEGKLWGFWVVVGINVLICIALIIVFIKKKMLK